MTRRRARPTAVRPQRRALPRDRRLDPAAWLWIAAGALFLVVGALVGAGLYTRYYVPPRETVLQVGDHKFQMGYFADRLQYYMTTAASEGRAASTAEAPNAVLNEMEREELLRQFADKEGLSVSDSEVDTAFRQKISDISGRSVPPAAPTDTPTATPAAEAAAAPSDASPSPTASPSSTASATAAPTPTPIFTTEDDYRNSLKDTVKKTRLSENEIREIARAEQLEKKLQDKLTTTLPAQVPQAQLDVIFVSSADRAKIDAAKKRLDAGEPFATVQADAGGTPQPPTWVVKEMLLDPFQGSAFSTPVGAYSDIIATDRGYGIVRVIAREERPLEAPQREFLLRDSVDKWMADRGNDVTVKRLLNAKKTQWALDKLKG